MLLTDCGRLEDCSLICSTKATWRRLCRVSRSCLRTSSKTGEDQWSLLPYLLLRPNMWLLGLIAQGYHFCTIFFVEKIKAPQVPEQPKSLLHWPQPVSSCHLLWNVCVCVIHDDDNDDISVLNMDPRWWKNYQAFPCLIWQSSSKDEGVLVKVNPRSSCNYIVEMAWLTACKRSRVQSLASPVEADVKDHNLIISVNNIGLVSSDLKLSRVVQDCPWMDRGSDSGPGTFLCPSLNGAELRRGMQDIPGSVRSSSC